MKDFLPDEVRRMSLAEAHAAMRGFQEIERARAGVEEDLEPPTRAEILAEFEKHEAAQK